MENKKCEKIKDQIADLIAGVLPATEIELLERHLSECSSCQAYAESLRAEDKLLTGMFADFDASIESQEDELINAINLLAESGTYDIISLCKMMIKDSVTRFAGAAAVIAVVTIYFVVTLTWINQITKCIELSS